MTFELNLKKKPTQAQFPPFKFPAKLFMNDEFSDVKICCEDKIYGCHKLVLISQSEVFKRMLSSKMKEATSGEIKITDISAKTMKDLLFFMYHGNLNDITITGDLLFAAEKYEILDLVNVCIKYLTDNLTEENAANAMIKSYMFDQKVLFRRACKFIFENQLKDKIVKTDDWKAMKEKDPALALEIMEEAMFQL